VPSNATQPADDPGPRIRQLKQSLDEANELAEFLRAEVADRCARTAIVSATLEATLRNAEDAIAVITHDLSVDMARPAAAALLEPDSGTLAAVLPQGSTATARSRVRVARRRGPLVGGPSMPQPHPHASMPLLTHADDETRAVAGPWWKAAWHAALLRPIEHEGGNDRSRCHHARGFIPGQ
jgi:hypothetical protein